VFKLLLGIDAIEAFAVGLQHVTEQGNIGDMTKQGKMLEHKIKQLQSFMKSGMTIDMT